MAEKGSLHEETEMVAVGGHTPAAPPHSGADPAAEPGPSPPPQAVPPEEDVGHPMHLTPYEDRLIRVVSFYAFYAEFKNI